MTVRRRQEGITLIESLAVVAMIALVAAVAGLYGMTWLHREQQRSAVYEIYVQVNLARVESVNRNRACRFTIEPQTRTIRVVDLMDPVDAGDDVEIDSVTLDRSIRFGTPDASPAVTLNPLTATVFEATFAADGSVTAGAGRIHLQSGNTFRRVSLFAGGGAAVERWDGSAWTTGS